MARPSSRPSLNALAVTPDSTVADAATDLEMNFFWEENRGKVFAVLAVALAGALVWGILQYMAAQKSDQAAAAFQTAKSKEQLQAVIKNFPDQMVAGNARLLLADQQRTEGKLDEALKTLQDFTQLQPKHPLIADAWMSYAATLEFKNDLPKAAETYGTIAAKYGNTQAAPAALFSQARLEKQQGNLKKARGLYQDLVQRFPASIWSQEAQRQIDRLPKE